MGVVVGVLKETAANETRVALIPEIAAKLKASRSARSASSAARVRLRTSPIRPMPTRN